MWRKFETLTSQATRRIITFGAIVGVVTSMPLFGLSFQPSWANGWGDLSKHTVFAVGLTTLLSLSSLGFATAFAGLAGARMESRRQRPYTGWMTVASIVSVALLAIAVAAPPIYRSIRADMVQTWR